MIRLAQLSDLNDIVEIENESFQGDRFSLEQIHYLLKEGKGIFLVFVSTDDRPVGYIYCVIYPNSKYARIHSIAVLFPRSGIGSDLLEEAEDKCRDLNKIGMTLEVRHNNINAIKFYEAMGFKFISMIENYYGPSQHAIKYRKEFYAK